MTDTRAPYPGEYVEPQPAAVDLAGDNSQTPTDEEHVRYALRRLNPEFHESDYSWVALGKIIADRDRALTVLRLRTTHGHNETCASMLRSYECTCGQEDALGVLVDPDAKSAEGST